MDLLKGFTKEIRSIIAAQYRTVDDLMNDLNAIPGWNDTPSHSFVDRYRGTHIPSEIIGILDCCNFQDSFSLICDGNEVRQTYQGFFETCLDENNMVRGSGGLTLPALASKLAEKRNSLCHFSSTEPGFSNEEVTAMKNILKSIFTHYWKTQTGFTAVD